MGVWKVLKCGGIMKLKLRIKRNKVPWKDVTLGVKMIRLKKKMYDNLY